MIKLKIASDLHLEWNENIHLGVGDVLILAGDILQYNVSQDTFLNYNKFFDIVSYSFDIIYYVAGNHEFYKGRFPDTYDSLRDYLSNWPNIVLLQNEYHDYKGYRFIGATLWTDYNKGNPIVQYEVERAMNDYKVIKIPAQNYRKMYPTYLHNEHIKSKEFIAKNINDNSIVITHHAPSELSVHEQYKDDYPRNYGYFSNLEDFIIEHSPKLWVHGHMHSCFDYEIGNTRVVCNPHGYLNENPEFNIERVIYV